ncbi:MAG: hypothetical protein NZ895_04035 [Archaeoglobaceae archaeon]|nr:hypothetical protein [Archaeoglobaceae archaeon]MCX8152030.1 hypothetical protein [Archaeoglobaceae archaeon]MDW8013587.1 hypothetical protein [Archaeoglobaceae archaeon]
MKLVLSLALLGIADSTFLLIHGCFGEYCVFLPFDEKIPAILGLLWFLSTPLAFKLEKIRIFWQLLGILGIAILLVISIVFSYFCILCFLAHVIGLIMIVLSTKNR